MLCYFYLLELYTAQQTREIGTKRRPYVKNTAQSSANGLASGGSEAPSEGSASWSVIPCFTPHTGHTRLRSVLNSLRDGRGCEAEQESRAADGTRPKRRDTCNAKDSAAILVLCGRDEVSEGSLTRCPKGVIQRIKFAPRDVHFGHAASASAPGIGQLPGNRCPARGQSGRSMQSGLVFYVEARPRVL